MNTLIRKLMESNDSFAPLALRIPVGIIFMAHGAWRTKIIRLVRWLRT